MRSTAIPAILAFAISASAASVRAAPPAAESSSATAAPESPEYKRAVEAALEEYRLGHFEEARTLFARAHALEPSARTERGLGMVEFELRHYVAALEHLEAALVSAVKPLTDEQRRSVEDLRLRAQQFVAQYRLEVEPQQEGVTVDLDGRRVSLAGARPVTLEAGEHLLRIEAPGTEARELHIDVKGGEQQTLRIQLEVKREAEPAPGPAPHVATRRQHDALALGLAVTGAGVAAVGGALGAVALSKASDSDTRDGSAADTARGLALGADVAIGVGVAAVVAGGIVWWLRRASPSAEAHVQARAGGLAVRF